MTIKLQVFGDFAAEKISFAVSQGKYQDLFKYVPRTEETKKSPGGDLVINPDLIGIENLQEYAKFIAGVNFAIYEGNSEAFPFTLKNPQGFINAAFDITFLDSQVREMISDAEVRGNFEQKILVLWMYDDTQNPIGFYRPDKNIPVVQLVTFPLLLNDLARLLPPKKTAENPTPERA
jgi:hypothetical protein